MYPNLGAAFMNLENMSTNAHDKRYKKLFELAKRYMVHRGYGDASMDLVNRTLPKV
jgi:hypothetical protein